MAPKGMFPDRETARRLASGVDLVPVAIEMFADMETPVSVFKRFEATSRFCFLLDSVEGGEKWARYSFIGRDPVLRIRSEGGVTTLEHRDGRTETISDVGPVAAVRRTLERFRAAHVPGLPRLSGGAVGYFGYDLVRYVEHLPDAPPDDLGLPECEFLVVDEMIVFDLLRQKLVLVVHLPTTGDFDAAYDGAAARLERLRDALLDRPTVFRPRTGDAPEKAAPPRSNLTKERFCEMVETAKEHIRAGDIFQVVLSQRFTTKAPAEPFDVYRVLRVSNPSPYMFYLKSDGYRIAGASPEMLVRCVDGVVETCPIAGTRRRGATPEEDAALEAELLADEKELSEHRMLVDLGRNDIGRVAEFGSVEVSESMKVMRYSHVMHITSNVKGRLRQGLTAFDALEAVLPAGTLSGAPKVRAMQIIDALEPTRRGIYGGAIGYISFDGNLDSCITIRTVVFKDGTAYVQAGAGIVADSVPEREYEETVAKAAAMVDAIQRQVE
jgi:anthranilate synthase component I